MRAGYFISGEGEIGSRVTFLVSERYSLWPGDAPAHLGGTEFTALTARVTVTVITHPTRGP